MTASGPPEPTEERRETSDTWKRVSLDWYALADDRDLDGTPAEDALQDRIDALLAAEEHLPRFEVVESSYSMPHDEPIRHVSIHQRWHARIKSRNGEITWTTETFEHRQHAIAAAHAIADLIGAKVTQDDGSEV